MRRRRYRLTDRDRPRLEIVPMIDIMMFLLVFFVLAVLKMIPDSGVALTLPEAATATRLKPVEITVVIDRSGALHIDNRIVTTAALQARLAGLETSGRKTEIVIAGDKSIRYDRLMQVMDAIRVAGITDIGLATRR